MKHELLQCYIRSGADLRFDVETSGTSKFLISTYSKNIQNAITSASINLGSVEECLKVTVKGTDYEKGDIVVLNQESYQSDVELGRIILILYDCEENVYFLCEKVHTLFRQCQRLYALGQPKSYVCVRQDELLSYYPCKSHLIQGDLLVKLKHAIVSTNM